MKLIICLTVWLSTTPHYEQGLQITKYLESIYWQFVDCHQWQTPMRQYFFADVSFCEIDTVLGILDPLKDSVNAIRVAIDDGGRCYRIAGLDTSDYDELIDAHPVPVSTDNVIGFGRFFLDLQMQPLLAQPYHISSVDAFVALNRALLEDSSAAGLQDKDWDEEVRKIQALLEPLKLGQVLYLADRRSFIVDYAVWNRNDGSLTYYQLAISQDGHCAVEKCERLAERLGYWGSREP